MKQTLSLLTFVVALVFASPAKALDDLPVTKPLLMLSNTITPGSLGGTAGGGWTNLVPPLIEIPPRTVTLFQIAYSKISNVATGKVDFDLHRSFDGANFESNVWQTLTMTAWSGSVATNFIVLVGTNIPTKYLGIRQARSTETNSMTFGTCSIISLPINQ